jgi:hypothetical protein
MAGSKAAYLENAALNTVLGGPQFTLPTNVYIALSTAAFTAAATGASLSEVTGSGYARVQVTNNTTNWPNAVNGAKSNNSVFTFPSATANWGTVLSFYIIDAASSGNVLYGADLTTSRTINSGDTASFAVGSITLTEN